MPYLYDPLALSERAWLCRSDGGVIVCGVSDREQASMAQCAARLAGATAAISTSIVVHFGICPSRIETLTRPVRRFWYSHFRKLWA